MAEDAAAGGAAPLLLESGRTPAPAPIATSIASSAAMNNAQTSSARGSDSITLLVEIAKATVPRRKRGGTDERGVHCTALWVGPTNPSGRRRRQRVLHRTKTSKIESQDDSGGDGAEGGENGVDGVDCSEHVFTVDDRSLFLFNTTMKQLVNASIYPNSDDDNSALRNGGLRFDLFERPLDVLTSVYSSVLADNHAEKEAHAITRESSSFSSYRLLGSVFLSSEEILSRCDEQRVECDLIEGVRKVQQQKRGGDVDATVKKVEGGSVALRFRRASDFDIAFMRTLERHKSAASGANEALQSTLVQHGAGSRLQPAPLVTEIDENVLAAESSMKLLGNLSPVAQESMRYLFSNDTEKRILVKPYPDPANVEDTTWFTEERLQDECYKPSTHWIQAGQAGGAELGKVYLEVLECRGLPNTDVGGNVGNKTDAFVSIVYGDVMVQTEVIDDSLSPMWMPWSTRAFVFNLHHPSTAIYIGVADYDVGPMEHECIGRVAIDMGKFSPSTLYTLTYKLYESSNLHEKGESMGTLTVRLRMEIGDEKKYLLEGWKAPEQNWINSQQWKSHRVAKYCVDGPHDEEVFEMTLFRSHINELMTQKRYLSYAIGDSVRSLVRWRGQVKVGRAWLPLHSAIVFYCAIHVVERPQLFPSFFLFGCGWIMIANMLNRCSHPNPWLRGHGFAHHWNVLTQGSSYRTAPKEIQSMEGHKEASKLEASFKQRIRDEDDAYYKQVELDAKIKSISDEAVIRTKAQGNGALVDPISAVAGAKLLPYQQRLGRYCNKMRYVKNVMNWNESVIAFFTTLMLFGAGFAALFVPWRFVILWSARILVWVGLGPWMKIIDTLFDEEAEIQKRKARTKAMDLFHLQRKAAKTFREHALKMKAFRVRLFGTYITRLPDFNLVRHEDVPLPESSAEPYVSKREITVDKFVPSQDLTGEMIPMTGQDDEAETTAKRKKQEKESLLAQYRTMADDPDSFAASDEDDADLDQGFELIGTEDSVPVGQLDAAPEEGVEVVPFVSNDESSSPTNQDNESELVSVLYVDEEATKKESGNDDEATGSAEETVNDEITVVKRVQFKETLTAWVKAGLRGSDLGLLAKPATDSTDKDALLKSVEETNALKLRCQRSRYDELEKKHYWKSTPMGIADEAKDKGEAGAVDKNGGLHHVAPGDDPLSALLPSNKAEEKKSLFGASGLLGGKKDNGARSRTHSRNGSLTESINSQTSSRSGDGEEDACKGSRWADFYSTREVLDVIEKDLLRLPGDSHKIYHEWRTREGLSKRAEDETSDQPKQGWSLGESFTSLLKEKSAGDLSALLDDGGDERDEEQKRKDTVKAEIQNSIRERAERLSQLLFVYAREYPAIGYRQGMHEVLSYILMAFEVDLLEQAIMTERKRWRMNSLTDDLSDKDGGMAGVDSTGKFVVVRLLDPSYILHDVFCLFESVMTALAPAYDVILDEEAKEEQGELPLEAMTATIMSKIRYVARDEELFSHVLYMPVPPHLYLTKWIRLMFSREVAGGMKSVFTMWGNFFDLASATASSQEGLPITTALLEVLKTAAAAMIMLIRHKLLAPTIQPSRMAGNPDPNVGIEYLMNYPPITDVGTLVETISTLLSREKKISGQQHAMLREKTLLSKERKLSKQFLPPESYNISPAADTPLDSTGVDSSVNGGEKRVPTESLATQLNEAAGAGQNESRQRNLEELPRVYRTSQPQLPKHDVAESIGHLAEMVVDFGAKTASAAIAGIDKHLEAHRQSQSAVDHPPQSNGAPSDPTKQKDDYVMSYRPYQPQTSMDNTAEAPHLPIGQRLQSEKELAKPPVESKEPTESDQDDQSTPELSVSKSVGDSVQKSSAELASLLEKSVGVLMKHFNEKLSTDADAVAEEGSGLHSSSVIPSAVWDALADIDLVRKELLSQSAIAAIGHSRSHSSLRSPGSSEGSGSQRPTHRSSGSRRTSWQLKEEL
ncbi:hypothetical protein ACHAXT_013164 [Thalassiosira profunda]